MLLFVGTPDHAASWRKLGLAKREHGLPSPKETGNPARLRTQLTFLVSTGLARESHARSSLPQDSRNHPLRFLDDVRSTFRPAQAWCNFRRVLLKPSPSKKSPRLELPRLLCRACARSGWWRERRRGKGPLRDTGVGGGWIFFSLGNAHWGREEVAVR